MSKMNKGTLEMKEKKVYMGSGPDTKEGFIHADIRALDNVDIVCKAWELSEHIQDVDHIYSRHMLEHLTNFEADRTLRDWYNSLNEDGIIQIIVPNIDYYFKQWLSSNWDLNKKFGSLSDEIFNMSSIFGWQRDSDPLEIETPLYWDVHKSGYNEKRMKYLLHHIGFKDIKITILNDMHLQAIAVKKKANNNNSLVSNYTESNSLDDKRSYDTIIQIYNKLNNFDKDKKYILYGYGSVGKLLFPYLKSNLLGVIDDSLDDTNIDGIKVFKSNDLLNLKIRNIIISPFLYNKQIKNDLKKYNCTFFELI